MGVYGLRAARTDANQTEIVKAIRKTGASVAITSMVGNGFPDLVVGFRNKTYLYEVKDPSKPPSKRQLTPDQQEFHKLWYGHAKVIETAEEALKDMGIL
jgi:hypothetical protein